MPRSINKIPQIISSFFLGFIICLFLTEFNLIPTEGDIKLLDIISLFISVFTLAIAYYFGSVLDRQKTKEGYKFDFVGSKLDDMRQVSKELNLLLSDKECKYTTVLSKLKQIGMMFEDFKEAIKVCDFEINQKEEIELMNYFTQVKRLATEDPKYDLTKKILLYKETNEVSIENDIIKYADVRINEVKTTLNKFNNLLFKYTVEN